MVRKADEIKILVVDDSGLTGHVMKNFLNKQFKIRVTGEARTAVEALEIISIEIPDIVILDFSSIGMEGVKLVQKLRKEFQEKLNYIMLITLEDLEKSSIIKDLEMHIVLKPVQLDILLQRVMELYDAPEQNCNPPAREFGLDETLSSIFYMIGIPAHIKGYRYLREAVKIVLNSPYVINKVTKVLYPGVAELFQTSPNRVERGIRHAIEVAWENREVENIKDQQGNSIFSIDKKPTNKEFIALLTNIVNIYLVRKDIAV